MYVFYKKSIDRFLIYEEFIEKFPLNENLQIIKENYSKGLIKYLDALKKLIY